MLFFVVDASLTKISELRNTQAVHRTDACFRRKCIHTHNERSSREWNETERKTKHLLLLLHWLLWVLRFVNSFNAHLAHTHSTEMEIYLYIYSTRVALLAEGQLIDNDARIKLNTWVNWDNLVWPRWTVWSPPHGIRREKEMGFAQRAISIHNISILLVRTLSISFARAPCLLAMVTDDVNWSIMFKFNIQMLEWNTFKYILLIYFRFPPSSSSSYTGTRIIYERAFLMNLKNSPLSRTPPSNLPSALVRGGKNVPMSKLSHTNGSPFSCMKTNSSLSKSPPLRKPSDEQQFDMDL